MKAVGIIANPASGKDIRRLVAYGSVFENNEKVNIVRRVLKALDARGIEQVYFMPDYFGIGVRALQDLHVSLKPAFLEGQFLGNPQDSLRAAAAMHALDVACIVTLGGDGTNRMVAKGCGDTPILPVSTGTNNVFPFMVEGTLAGLVAGVLAEERFPEDDLCRRVPKLEIVGTSGVLDVALVDVVVSDSDFIGTRAIWEPDTVREIFLTRSQPGTIGFSSVGGHLCPQPPGSRHAVHIVTGPGKWKVQAPIAPGLICDLPIASSEVVPPMTDVPVTHVPSVIALDGEREVMVKRGSSVSVRFNPEGPWVVEINETLRWAAADSLFLRPQ